jgi:hypothetical protein
MAWPLLGSFAGGIAEARAVGIEAAVVHVGVGDVPQSRTPARPDGHGSSGTAEGAGLPALRVGQAIGPGTKDGLWVGQWARLWREYAGQDERTLKASDPPIVEALF